MRQIRLIESIEGGWDLLYNSGSSPSLAAEGLSADESLATVEAILFDYRDGPRYLKTMDEVQAERKKRLRPPLNVPSDGWDMWAVVKDDRPYKFTFWHSSREAADTEAERLAHTVGGKFFVLRVMAACKAFLPDAVWETEEPMPF